MAVRREEAWPIGLAEENDWLIVRTIGDEMAAVERMNDRGHECFLPLIWDGSRSRALYPRYVFVRRHPGWGALNRVDGVAYVLTDGPDSPGTVDDQTIINLRRQMVMGGGAIIEDWWRRGRPRQWKPRDPVKVLHGEHVGRIGFVQAAKSKHGRVAVMLDTTTGTRLVSLPAHYLALLSVAPPAA